ncbi:hypothetical protein VNO78_12080 [Psophocarpus tetragonolobus]|uniref:Uncharacterized protein n=1 Tax=Psophocarpus tetragonolobus TaxID=3891 RepID=A0AAN9SUV8_PSOTE
MIEVQSGAPKSEREVCCCKYRWCKYVHCFIGILNFSSADLWNGFLRCPVNNLNTNNRGCAFGLQLTTCQTKK